MIRFKAFTRAEIAGGCGVALPMISGDVKAALRGRSDGIVVIMQGARPGTEPEEAVLLCIHAKDAGKNAIEIMLSRRNPYADRSHPPDLAGG